MEKLKQRTNLMKAVNSEIYHEGVEGCEDQSKEFQRREKRKREEIEEQKEDVYEKLSSSFGSLAWCVKSVGVVLFHLLNKKILVDKPELISILEKLFSPGKGRRERERKQERERE